MSKTYSREDLLAAIAAWQAWSVANLCFSQVEGQTKLLLGQRRQPPTAIPEPGQYALIGGFNDILPGPAMFADLANAHMLHQISLRHGDHYTSGDFVPCEFPMEIISAPLNTPLGPLPIKRVSNMRLVWIDPDAIPAIMPQNKIANVQWVTLEELSTLALAKQLTFPHQVEMVMQIFPQVRSAQDVQLLKPGWTR